MSAISFNDSLPLLSSAESSGYQKDDSSDSKRIKRVAEQSMNLTESSSQHSVKLGDINSEIQPGQHSIASFATSLLPYSTESTEEVKAGEVTASKEGAKKPVKKKKAAKKEEDLIDEAVKELEKNRIGTIRTRHDGLVQESDVFTTSLGRTPGGRGRDRGVSRDTF